MAISFFTEDTTYKLKEKSRIRQWLKKAAKNEGAEISELNYIFCSDNYLLELNKKYLDHDTLTDIITFDASVRNPQSIVDSKKQKPPTTDHRPLTVSGDIFISIDRVRENAKTFKVKHEQELHRVVVHGLLHLLGYKDKTKQDKLLMTSKEDHYLNLF